MAIGAVVVITIVGGGALFLLGHYRQLLLAWISEDAFRAKAIVLLLVAIASLPLPAVAAYLWRLGGKVIRGNRHPPEGIKLVRDTPVIYGPSAQRRGRAYQALGVILLFSFGCVLWILWQLWQLM